MLKARQDILTFFANCMKDIPNRGPCISGDVPSERVQQSFKVWSHCSIYILQSFVYIYIPVCYCILIPRLAVGADWQFYWILKKLPLYVLKRVGISGTFGTYLQGRICVFQMVSTCLKAPQGMHTIECRLDVGSACG